MEYKFLGTKKSEKDSKKYFATVNLVRDDVLKFIDYKLSGLDNNQELVYLLQKYISIFINKDYEHCCNSVRIKENKIILKSLISDYTYDKRENRDKFNGIDFHTLVIDSDYKVFEFEHVNFRGPKAIETANSKSFNIENNKILEKSNTRSASLINY